ncbi:MAG TPA: hypothetical protein VKB49_23915 [Candidatus Sulfotelmatobacter sp.]|nr:hypothetical protein [Candidatus Sulfotelmatobacter sp.]
MSRLRGHWPEAPNLTYYRGLTARPAVLAKTYGHRAVILPVQRSTARPGRSRFKIYPLRTLSGVVHMPACNCHVELSEILPTVALK